MAENNLVSFKVFLEVDGASGQFEIRRFGIESDVATSYSYLVEKVKAVYPTLQNASDIHIYWKDAENDDIRICSDAELIIALTEIQQPIKKLFVKQVISENGVHQDNPQHVGTFTETPDGIEWGNSNLHPSVVCDGCEGPVVGFRYKCLQCRDYDLCSNCDAKCFHPEHFMLRMPTPAIIDACVIDERRKDRKGCRKNWHDAALSAMESSRSPRAAPVGGCPFNKKMTKKYLKHHSISSRKLFDTISDVMMQVISNVNDTTPQAECSSGQNINRSDNNNNTTRTAAAAVVVDPEQASVLTSGSNVTNPTATSTTGNTAGVSNLINLNETDVAACIGSLVQNLDTVMGNIFKSSSSECENKAKTNTDNNTGNNSQSQHSSVQEDKFNTNSNTSTAAAPIDLNALIRNIGSLVIQEMSKGSPVLNNTSGATVASNGNIGNAGSATSMPKTDSAVTGGVTPAPPTAPRAQGEILTPDEFKKVLLGDDGIRVHAVSPQEPLSDAENGWTLLNEEKQNENCAKTANESTGAIPKTSSYSTKKPADQTGDFKDEKSSSTGSSESDEERLNIEKKVEESLRRLLAMGFSNEGNWLYHLVADKKGDIRAVIDQLIPNPK